MGERVLSRIIMDGEKELRFQEVGDESLRKQAELSVLKGVAKFSKNKELFINMPISIHIESLPLYGRNFVICLPSDLSSDTLAKILLSIKKLKLKSALDDYKKVQLAIDCGADYGHGYFFGYETYNIPLE